jgi:hypothetical protein
VFGNGTQARAKRILQNQIDENGITVTELHFIPTPEMMDYYHLKYSDMNKENLLVMTYPQVDVIIPEIKDGTLIKTVFILTDYMGGQTILSEKFPETKMVQRFQVENKILRAKIASLEDENHLILTRPEEYIKKKTEMIKKARDAGGDIVQPGFMPDQGYAPPLSGVPPYDYG